MKRTPQYLAMALMSGLLLTFSWPANGIPFLALVALVPLFWLQERLSHSRFAGIKMLGYAYLAFFVWNLLTTYWIYFSSPEGAYMAVLVNSLFMALVWVIAFSFRKALGTERQYVALVLFWLSFEFLHQRWDLSWPWLMLGNAFANYVQFIQWYEITGVPGGTVWIMLSNILAYRLLRKVLAKKPLLRPALAWAACLLLPVTASFIRYATYTEKSSPVNIVLVQPNIDPWKDKFGRMTPRQQMTRMLDQARNLTDSSTDYVICPETAIPVGVWDHELVSNPQIVQIQEFMAPYPRLSFITGISHLQLYAPGPEVPGTAERYGNSNLFWDDHNSAIQIDHSGKFQLYHKSKLVPGPEMFPFAEVLKPLQYKLFGNLGGQIGDMGTQPERSVFRNTRADFVAAPVICYESIYGEFVGDYMLKGGNFISVSTNDAWWGNTPGHKQLLAYTRLRAVETRRSVARSANTGISCFINQRGDVLQYTKYMETTAIRGTINTNSRLTFYSRHGDYLGRAALWSSLMLLGYALVLRFGGRRRKQ